MSVSSSSTNSQLDQLVEDIPVIKTESSSPMDFSMFIDQSPSPHSPTWSEAQRSGPYPASPTFPTGDPQAHPQASSSDEFFGPGDFFNVPSSPPVPERPISPKSKTAAYRDSEPQALTSSESYHPFPPFLFINTETDPFCVFFSSC